MKKLEKKKDNDRVIWIQDCYREIPINCGMKKPSLLDLIEALYVFIYGCTGKFKHPRGYHVRTRLSAASSPATYCAHINNYYKGKSGYIPLRLSVKETDDSGLHYHHAFILNDKLDRKSSLQRVHAHLQKEGHLIDYSIVCPDNDWHGQHLTTKDELHSYFKWMSYLAKVRTKPDKGQVWSGSRDLTTKLDMWRKAGKPDLSKEKISTHHKAIATTLSCRR